MSTSFRKSLQDAYAGYLITTPNKVVAKSEMSESVRSGVEIIPLYSFQSIIRPLFGKGSPELPDIGDHPDFVGLKGTKQVIYAPITTLFMDIESSTRLSLIYPLEKVYRIKNAFICAAIEIVKAFDGHVHRIMGDAVMAFFGGTKSSPEYSAVDALNCATVLRYFVDAVVIPALSSEGFDDPFGIRIGVDYGSKSDVLWSSYGYPGMDEVTATSFFVDVASKLQHAAGRNQIMIGASLKDFLDFPEVLLKPKTVLRDGKELDIPYLQPNHTDKNGRQINYRQYLLDWQRYLELTPIAQTDEIMGIGNNNFQVVTEIYSEKENGLLEGIYPGCGFILPVNKGLLFKPKISSLIKKPYVVKYSVENHGKEAKEAAEKKKHTQQIQSEPFDNHTTEKKVDAEFDVSNIPQMESTAYRGLHYMTVEVANDSGIQQKCKIGVYVF